MSRHRGILGIFLVLSGCMVGPNYEKPETNMPAAFVEAEETLSSSDEEFHEWWRHFEPLKHWLSRMGSNWQRPMKTPA